MGKKNFKYFLLFVLYDFINLVYIVNNYKDIFFENRNLKIFFLIKCI